MKTLLLWHGKMYGDLMAKNVIQTKKIMIFPSNLDSEWKFFSEMCPWQWSQFGKVFETTLG